jgi:hypothetical protein
LDAHLAAPAVERGLTLCSTDGNCDTLGPWSDFIKEFGFVLPKPSKRIQSVTKMQMWAHESRSAPFGGAT